MMREYNAPDISCGHCKQKVEAALLATEGVDAVEVDVESKTVRVEGVAEDSILRTALAEAGYPVGPRPPGSSPTT